MPLCSPSTLNSSGSPLPTPYPLRQLVELCAAHPLEPKILLAPGVRAGYDLTTVLVRSGQQWTNLRVTTPVLDAAEQMEPQMAALGVRRLRPEGRRRLVDALLADWPLAERRYFRGMAAGVRATDAGLAESLYNTFDALRLAHVLPEHAAFQSDAGLSTGGKVADLADLFDRYVEALHTGSWWDDAALLMAAVRAASEHAPTSAIWVILDEVDLPPLAADYVSQRASGRLWRLGRRAYGVRPPTFSAAAWFPRAPIPGENPGKKKAGPPLAPAIPPRKAETRRQAPERGLVDLIQGDLFLDPLREADLGLPPGDLFAPFTSRTGAPESVEVAPGGRLLTDGLTPQDADRVRLVQVIGLETEIRFVLRDVLERGLPLDDVEIAYAAATPYQGLLFDAVERWDLPADFAAGVPTSLTRPGRWLAAFLGWVADDLDGAVLAEHLRAGEFFWTEKSVSPGAVARWLLQGHAGAGREQTLAALDRLTPASSDDDFGARLAAGRAQLEVLFDCVPDSDEVDALVYGALRFLRGQGVTGDTERAERDRRIRDHLVSHLQDLCGLPDVFVPRAVQAQRLLETLRRHSCEAGPARPGRLRVAPLHEAGYSGRRHLYILGLDESLFPGAAVQDPILLDEERRALSSGLRQEATRAGDGVFHLVRLLGSAAGTATLLASRLHLADGREPYPTPLFEQARHQLQREPTWCPPAPEAEVAATDEMETALAHRRDPGMAASLVQAYPDTARGLRAVHSRTAAAPSRFSGWIARRDVESLDLQGTRTLSSRMLETLAECPRRYLMRYTLGLVPPEEPQLDPRRWLHPLEMGNLLHGLFLDFMQELQEKGERPGEGHEVRLQELIRVAIGAQRERVPVELEAGYRNDCRRIDRAARIFLHAEAQRLAADPALYAAAFELDFGFDPEHPVEVSLSHEVAFRLCGRIDRVDGVRDASGETTAHEIWDYKTGSTFNYSATDMLQGGRRLQWALYAYALPHLVDGDGDVRLSGYFFASDRGSGQRFSDAPPVRHELAQVLRPLFDLARQGFFPALHKADARGGGPCRFCDYRRVCASEARGADQVDDLLEAAAQLSALVEGWAEAVAAGRPGSRQSLEVAFDNLGLVPGDVAPPEAARSAHDWIRS